MITHEMSVARAVAERVIVLDRGRIAEEGPTGQIFASPGTGLTRRLIGAALHAPEAVPAAHLSTVFRPGGHAIPRLTASGAAARRSLVGDIARATGREPLVLAAQVERLAAGPVAILTLALPDGSPGRVAALRQALADRLSPFEVIGYADDPL